MGYIKTKQKKNKKLLKQNWTSTCELRRQESDRRQDETRHTQKKTIDDKMVVKSCS